MQPLCCLSTTLTSPPDLRSPARHNIPDALESFPHLIFPLHNLHPMQTNHIALIAVFDIPQIHFPQQGSYLLFYNF